MPKIYKLIVIVLILGGFGVPFLGVFRDREFGELYLFLKHKPTHRFFFCSPIGTSDRTIEALDPIQQNRELRYREYIEDGEGYKRVIFVGWSDRFC